MIKIYEKKEIRNQLIKNIILNFIIFTLILLIFDFLIYKQLVSSLYKDIDMQLEILTQGNNEEPKEERKANNANYPNETFEKGINEDIEISPRLIIIERDENGEIINSDTLGSLNNYDVKFNITQLNVIYNIQVREEYTYRGINYEIVENGETKYIQILANVDGEAGTLDILLNILIVGTIVLIFVSMLISYLLSINAMKPVIEAYKKQTEFVQNASHELRTPLTIIQAKEELLLTEPNAKIIEKSEDINLVLKETKRLTKLVKELMDLARGDEQNVKIQKELTDINELIKEVVQPYIDVACMQEKNVKLDLKCDKKVKINKNKISELMIIVLDNAIKYTNKLDEIIIKTYWKDGKCNIEVQDTGIGISDEAINHIFDRFYREDKARSRETGGNGLGLSIAKMIVTSHGGSICALHNNPKGTIIMIKI